MAKRGAIDLEFDAVKARLDLEFDAVKARLDDLETALGALLDAKTEKPKTKKADKAKEPE